METFRLPGEAFACPISRELRITGPENTWAGKVTDEYNQTAMKSFNENFDPVFLSDNIRSLRKLRNWSQEELAQKIGLNRGNIASYEKGTAEPKICNLLKLAQLFGVSIFDLTGKDLRNGEEGAQLAVVGPFSMQDQERLQALVTRFKELEKVVESIYNCHCFNMKHTDDPDKDLQTLNLHFEQLHQVTHALLKSHQNLLDFVQEKCLGQSRPEE